LIAERKSVNRSVNTTAVYRRIRKRRKLFFDKFFTPVMNILSMKNAREIFPDAKDEFLSIYGKIVLPGCI
jgi:hypothetical protein